MVHMADELAEEESESEGEGEGVHPTTQRTCPLAGTVSPSRTGSNLQSQHHE